MALLAFWVLEVSTFIFILFAFEYLAGGHLLPAGHPAPGAADRRSSHPVPVHALFPGAASIWATSGVDALAGLVDPGVLGGRRLLPGALRLAPGNQDNTPPWAAESAELHDPPPPNPNSPVPPPPRSRLRCFAPGFTLPLHLRRALAQLRSCARWASRATSCSGSWWNCSGSACNSLHGVIYRHTDHIGTWTKWQVVLLIGASHFIQQLFTALFLINCTKLSENVRTGELDFLLLLPVNTRFLVSLRQVDLGGVRQRRVRGRGHGLCGARSSHLVADALAGAAASSCSWSGFRSTIR